MTTKLSYLLPCLLWLAAMTIVFAAPEPNPFFSPGVVLARDHEVTIFGGKAVPGERVSVTLAGHTGSTTAGTNGNWRVTLSPLPVGSAYTLTIDATSGRTVITDVAIGDLWLCSGQSNMKMQVKDSDVAKLAAESPADAQFRLFEVPLDRKPEPQGNFADKVNWKVSSPETAISNSAVAWAFGHALRQQTNVPVGVVIAAWGGTRAISWTPRSALEPLYADKLAEFDEAMKHQPSDSHYKAPLGHFNTPIDIYNAVIHPLTPITFTGVLWYQGEQDTGLGLKYKDSLETMIAGWRKAFSEPKLPFLIVQLPGFGSTNCEGFPPTRTAQALAVKETPNTGLIVTVDTGDANTIHPRQKLLIGERAALAAGFIRGFKFVWQAPAPKCAVLTNDDVRVSFMPTTQVLTSLDRQPLRAFELAGEDGKYVKAEAVVDASDTSTIIVRGLTKPVKVRYAGKPWPDANLGAKGNLAVAPFELELNH